MSFVYQPFSHLVIN